MTASARAVPFVLLAIATSCRTSSVSSERPRTFFAEHVEGGRTVTLAGESRKALTGPASSTVSFELDLPEDAVARFSIGVRTLERPVLGRPVEFRASIETGGELEPLFSSTVKRAMVNRWFPAELDLSAWGGTRVRLVLETSSAASDDAPIQSLWGSPVITPKRRASDAPDIVLVSIDCLRADHVGAYGYERDTTPHLDAFAENAVLFREARSTSIYTLPTHASMLTGLPGSMHGATLGRGISSTVAYLPEILATAGYRLDGVVSAPYLTPSYGFHRGFHSYTVVGGRGSNVIDAALERRREAGGQPQFLFVHLFDAHWPYAPPGEFVTRFADRPPDISELLARVGQESPPRSEQDVARLVQLYDGEIAYADQELGRLFEVIETSPHYERSLVIVTADHGEAFYENGYWQHGLPARNANAGLHDELLHIPLIVKFPGRVDGAEVSTLVSQTDLFATILDVAGAPGETSWSRSLTRFLDTKPAAPKGALFAEYGAHIPNGGVFLELGMITTSRTQVHTLRAESVSTLYSYDVWRDHLASETPLSPADRSALQAFHRDAKRYADSRTDDEVVSDPNVLRQLEALGYVER